MSVPRIDISLRSEGHGAGCAPAQSRVFEEADSETGRRSVDGGFDCRCDPAARGDHNTVSEGHCCDFGLFAIGKNGDGENGTVLETPAGIRFR